MALHLCGGCDVDHREGGAPRGVGGVAFGEFFIRRDLGDPEQTFCEAKPSTPIAAKAEYLYGEHAPDAHTPIAPINATSNPARNHSPTLTPPEPAAT